MWLGRVHGRVGMLAGAVAVLVAGVGASPPSAHAAAVRVLGRDGRAIVRADPFVTAPSVARTSAYLGARSPTFGPQSAAPTVRHTLRRLRKTGAITAAAYHRYLSIYSHSVAAVGRLHGTRAAELGAVIANVREMAAAGTLTAHRLPAVFETLARNHEWWTSGHLLAPNQLVTFAGSQLVWEYYPGQGIELQVQATFSTAVALCHAGPAHYPAMAALLREMISLATQRAGGVTWEYYFHFDGSSPPWTSAISQGTALQALACAYRAFHERSYLKRAHRALAIFTVGPPLGVAIRTRRGAWYLEYSFAPQAYILNGFLQSLIGLHAYANVSGDPLAQRLFSAGDAVARARVPNFDTGAWSLYQPGVEDTLSYHLLVTQFLEKLCAITGARVYCVTAKHFKEYLKTPPALTLLTHLGIAGRPLTVRFELSKISHLKMVVRHRGRTVFRASAQLDYGTRAFTLPALKAGTYKLTLAATDLAGNFNQIIGTLTVS